MEATDGSGVLGAFMPPICSGGTSLFVEGRCPGDRVTTGSDGASSAPRTRYLSFLYFENQVDFIVRGGGLKRDPALR